MPFAMVVGYKEGRETYKKFGFYSASNLIIINEDSSENYCIFTHCCMYLLLYLANSIILGFIFTLLIGFLRTN